MSRPKLPPEERKSVRVLVRLTPEQLKKVQEMREVFEFSTGPGLSTFLRNVIMGVIAGDSL
jgi:hypothetical protein